MRDRLQSEIGQISAGTPASGVETGGHDHGQLQTIANEMALEQAESSMQQAVRDALSRIESGIYGWCQDCGGAIAKARLDALPHAAFCIGCERKHEV